MPDLFFTPPLLAFKFLGFSWNLGPLSIFQLLDYLGTLVFAISGALAAMNRRFDLFGVLILALVTAVGGGTLRDVMIGRTPVGWMRDPHYAYIILVAVFLALRFHKRLAYFRRTMFLFDAMGLGLFTIIGVELGLQAQLQPSLCVLMGTMSASFGGVLRDILSNQVPLVFHQEVYASLSILGGAVFLVLQHTPIPSDLIYVSTSVLVIVLRILAVRKKWVLPKFYKIEGPS